MKPTIRYDKEGDALYVQFQQAAVEKTRRLDDLRLVDHASDGTIIGVEFLDVSGGIDLQDVPEARIIEDAIRRLGLRLFA